MWEFLEASFGLPLSLLPDGLSGYWGFQSAPLRGVSIVNIPLNDPRRPAWCRAGGLKGGPARAKSLSPERRKEIARMGGLALQAKYKIVLDLPSGLYVVQPS